MPRNTKLNKCNSVNGVCFCFVSFNLKLEKEIDNLE